MIIELFLLCCSWSSCSSQDVSRCRNPRQESRPCCFASVHWFSLHPQKYHLKEGACSISRFLTWIPFFEIMISMAPGLRLHNSCRLGRKCSFDIDKKLFHWDLMQSVPWNVKIKTQTCILECESKIQTTIWTLKENISPKLTCFLWCGVQNAPFGLVLFCRHCHRWCSLLSFLQSLLFRPDIEGWYCDYCIAF